MSVAAASRAARAGSLHGTLKEDLCDCLVRRGRSGGGPDGRARGQAQGAPSPTRFPPFSMRRAPEYKEESRVCHEMRLLVAALLHVPVDFLHAPQICGLRPMGVVRIQGPGGRAGPPSSRSSLATSAPRPASPHSDSATTLAMVHRS